MAGQVLVQARLLPQHEVLKERVLRQALLPGEVAGQQAEKQHAEGPGIQAGVNGHPLSIGSVAELGRGVGDHPGHQLELGTLGPRKPEVSQLDAPALGIEKQHVLWLDVTVHEAAAVDELQRAHQLLGTLLRGRLGDPILRRERGTDGTPMDGSPAGWTLCTGEDLCTSGLASLKLLQRCRPQRDPQPIAFMSLPPTQPAFGWVPIITVPAPMAL